MGVIAEAVRHMLAAGVDAEAIVSAIEGMESAGSRRAKSDGRATRLARDWWPSKELIDWAAAEGLSAQEINREVERMRDWSASSPKGAKLDWNATWRGWVRRVIENRDYGNGRVHRNAVSPKPGPKLISSNTWDGRRGSDYLQAFDFGRSDALGEGDFFGQSGTVIEAFPPRR